MGFIRMLNFRGSTQNDHVINLGNICYFTISDIDESEEARKIIFHFNGGEAVPFLVNAFQFEQLLKILNPESVETCES